MNTLLHPVRYSHSVIYNGLNPKLKGLRMTLRIEQVSASEFLVTKSICSKGDNFVKALGRRFCDLKKNVHDECVSHSEYYGLDDSKIGSIVISKTELDPDPITVTITPVVHNDFSRHRTKHIADIVEITTSITDTRALVEIILDTYRNDGKYANINYY